MDSHLFLGSKSHLGPFKEHSWIRLKQQFDFHNSYFANFLSKGIILLVALFKVLQKQLGFYPLDLENKLDFWIPF